MFYNYLFIITKWNYIIPKLLLDLNLSHENKAKFWEQFVSKLMYEENHLWRVNQDYPGTFQAGSMTWMAPQQAVHYPSPIVGLDHLTPGHQIAFLRTFRNFGHLMI